MQSKEYLYFLEYLTEMVRGYDEEWFGDLPENPSKKDIIQFSCEKWVYRDMLSYFKEHIEEDFGVVLNNYQAKMYNNMHIATKKREQLYVFAITESQSIYEAILDEIYDEENAT